VANGFILGYALTVHQTKRSTLNYSMLCPFNPPLLFTNPVLFWKFVRLKSFTRADRVIVGLGLVVEGGAGRDMEDMEANSIYLISKT
jgi:hypothetical protein